MHALKYPLLLILVSIRESGQMPPSHVWVHPAKAKGYSNLRADLSRDLFFFEPAPKSSICSKLLLIHLLLCVILFWSCYLRIFISF